MQMWENGENKQVIMCMACIKCIYRDLMMVITEFTVKRRQGLTTSLV